MIKLNFRWVDIQVTPKDSSEGIVAYSETPAMAIEMEAVRTFDLTSRKILVEIIRRGLAIKGDGPDMNFFWLEFGWGEGHLSRLKFDLTSVARSQLPVPHARFFGKHRQFQDHILYRSS